MLPITGPMALQRETIRQMSAAVSRFDLAPDQIERMRSVEVGHTESDVIYRENKLELHHYAPSAGVERQHIPILIVYALINRPYILDLQPDRSVVRALTNRGFDVYLIDWGEPSALDTHLSLSDYVLRYLDNCVDTVRAHAEVDTINMLGYCMGGTMSVMYAAFFPEKVRNLGLMAAGVCFDETGGILETWGDDSSFSPETLVDTFGNVPAPFLDLGFQLMDPIQNLVGKYTRLYDNLEDEEFVENFARMERWLEDGIDVAGRTYREFIEEIYQENALYRNELTIDDRDVDLENIEMPVLQIVGEYDHLIPPDSSTPLNDAVASDDTDIFRMETGHIGLSVSSRSHDELWPSVCDWFVERSRPPPSPVETLQQLDGIGTVYSERLVEAGLDSIEALAGADIAYVSDAADVSETEARAWIDRAAAAE